MDRIRTTFDRLRRRGRKALIPFIMGGDPDLEATGRLIEALAGAGADLIEIGVPFSDPLADGPTIQRASSRALAHGTTPASLLELVQRVSRTVEAPIVLLSYWNPIVQYRNGAARNHVDPQPFLRRAQEAGVCGVVVPDLPPEEGEPLRAAAQRCGVATIFLAAPTSPPERLRQIARASNGFIYYVSLTGTTGARTQLSADWRHGVRQIKLITTKPVCVGFGISTPAQAAAVARVADGAIIGSALLNALEPHLRSRSGTARRAAAFLRPFRRVL